MKTILACLLAVGFAPASRAADDRAAADAAWAPVGSLMDAGPGLWELAYEHDYNAATIQTLESYARVLRTEGLAFWDRYPGDVRRLGWLPRTLKYRPAYWKSPAEAAKQQLEAMKSARAGGAVEAPAIDEEAKAAWDRRYPQLRAEFLAAPGLTDLDRARFSILEMHQRLPTEMAGPSRNPVYEPGAEGSGIRRELEDEMLATAGLKVDWPAIDAENRMTGSDLRSMADTLLEACWISGDGAPGFIARLAASPNESLRRYGAGETLLAAWTKEPMDLSFTAMDGREVDLRKMRGRMVLIVYWDTGCAGCIQQIPKLKAVYDKYHGKGFEIVGFCGDKEADRRKVEDFVAKHGMPWPQRLSDKAGQRDDYRKYDFVWVSNELLLDTRGLLVAHAAGLSQDHLESLVQRGLASAPGGAETRL